MDKLIELVIEYKKSDPELSDILEKLYFKYMNKLIPFRLSASEEYKITNDVIEIKDYLITKTKIPFNKLKSKTISNQIEALENKAEPFKDEDYERLIKIEIINKYRNVVSAVLLIDIILKEQRKLRARYIFTILISIISAIISLIAIIISKYLVNVSQYKNI